MNLPEAIPATLEDAIDTLVAALAEEDKAYILSPESTPGAIHHFGGMALRNTWNLWGARPGVSTILCDHFKTRFGLGCADDMSGMILKGLWARLRGDAYDADADAAYYHAFWRRQGRDALTQEVTGPPAPPEDRGFLRAPVPPRDRYRHTFLDRVFEFFGGLFRFDPSADPGGIR
jgi:hypothetical protein